MKELKTTAQQAMDIDRLRTTAEKTGKPMGESAAINAAIGCKHRLGAAAHSQAADHSQ
jgi:hypothetical protein